MPVKTEIYTWRVSTAVKTRLEEAARVRRRSVAELLDELVTEGLDITDRDSAADVERQHRLHRRAGRFLGCIAGGHARRSEHVRELVRSRLNKHRDRARS
jgi:hypothetical protein